MNSGMTRFTTGVAIFAAAAFFIFGLTVPVIVTHDQDVNACTAGAGCGPCSSSFSLFSWILGEPLSTNCEHPEATSSSSSTATYTVSNGLADATLEYPNILANLTLGAFSFRLVYNATGYAAGNGTIYGGFDVVFDVANQTQSQTVIFQWGLSGPTKDLPSPTNASLYGGAVTMSWTATSSAYPYATGPAAFLNILVKTPSA